MTPLRSLAVAALAATLSLSATPTVNAAPVEPSSRQAAPVWQKPTTGKVSAPYGPRLHPITGTMGMHDGVDYSGKAGNPVLAASGGLARVVKTDAEGPNFVIIIHPNGVKTKYAHMRSTTLVRGVKTPVVAGQQIGEVGRKGYASGPHLHFIVVKNGRTVDPVPFLKRRVNR